MGIQAIKHEAYPDGFILVFSIRGLSRRKVHIDVNRINMYNLIGQFLKRRIQDYFAEKEGNAGR